MIKFTTELDNRKFYLFLLKLYSVQNISLTDREVELGSYLLSSKYYPFSGRGRRKIIRDMDISSANFSILLGKLVSKGVIDKSEDHNDYSFSKYFQYFKRKWEEGNEIQIGYIIKKQKDDYTDPL